MHRCSLSCEVMFEYMRRRELAAHVREGQKQFPAVKITLDANPKGDVKPGYCVLSHPLASELSSQKMLELEHWFSKTVQTYQHHNHVNPAEIHYELQDSAAGIHEVYTIIVGMPNEVIEATEDWYDSHLIQLRKQRDAAIEFATLHNDEPVLIGHALIEPT